MTALMWPYDVLGLSAGPDAAQDGEKSPFTRKEIRLAYSKRLKALNQQTQSTEFEDLRAAYEQALAMLDHQSRETERPDRALFPQSPSASKHLPASPDVADSELQPGGLFESDAASSVFRASTPRSEELIRILRSFPRDKAAKQEILYARQQLYDFFNAGHLGGPPSYKSKIKNGLVHAAWLIFGWEREEKPVLHSIITPELADLIDKEFGWYSDYTTLEDLPFDDQYYVDMEVLPALLESKSQTSAPKRRFISDIPYAVWAVISYLFSAPMLIRTCVLLLAIVTVSPFYPEYIPEPNNLIYIVAFYVSGIIVLGIVAFIISTMVALWQTAYAWYLRLRYSHSDADRE